MFDHALPPSLPARLLSAASLRQRGVEKTAMNGPQRELRESEPERRDIGSRSEPCRSGLRSQPGCCNHQTDRRGSKGKTVDQPGTENHIYQEAFEALEAIWTCSAFIHTGPRHIVMLHAEARYTTALNELSGLQNAKLGLRLRRRPYTHERQPVLNLILHLLVRQAIQAGQGQHLEQQISIVRRPGAGFLQQRTESSQSITSFRRSSGSPLRDSCSKRSKRSNRPVWDMGGFKTDLRCR